MISSDPKLYGFRILKFLELQDWKLLEINNQVVLTSQEECPSDNNKLSVLVSLISGDGSKKIRLGLCESCGYFGYIDRPQKEWMDKFYEEVWDEAPTRDIRKEAENKNKEFLSKDKKRKTAFLDFLKRFNVDRKKPVLEIGSGYGRTLSNMRKIGFNKVLGLESSPHRAKISREAHGLEIYSSPFENSKLQVELKKMGPFGLIISHHVLEHTYNPAEILQLASGLQDFGDFLLLSLPNSEGEFSASQIFFLPHLHSFSKESLEKLLNSSGYSIVDDSYLDEDNINIVARKDLNPIVKYPSRNYREEKFEKLKKGLGLGIIHTSSLRELWWDRKIDIGGQAQSPRASLLLSRYITNRKDYIGRFGIKKWLIGSRKLQRMSVKSLVERFTSFNDSPIEIQYDGDIRLSYR